MIVFDSDDFGANHVISGACQSHDCRDILDKLHYANNNFKATLFAIPAEMTQELLDWCEANNGWIELAVHGFTHRDNWECEKMTYEDMDANVATYQTMLDKYFVKGFKAPGWQISQDVLEWLHDRGWWVADQSYNNDRRPTGLPAYVIDNVSEGRVLHNGIPSEVMVASHHHCWDCVGNGVYEQYDQIISEMSNETIFKFVSEVI